MLWWLLIFHSIRMQHGDIVVSTSAKLAALGLLVYIPKHSTTYLEFVYSPCASVSFLWLLWCPPTLQKHA